MDVLIVEDEALIAMEIQDILEHAGHHVVGHAISAPKAVELAAETHPDLALVDVRLADQTDGVAAAKDMNERLRVPCLMVTSHCREAQRANGAAMGCLEKPFHESDLIGSLDAIAHMLQGEAPERMPPKLRLFAP